MISTDIRGTLFSPIRVDNFNFPCGWVLPGGSFYGCGFAEHEAVLDTHFDSMTIEQAEEFGWLRITKMAPYFQIQKRMTIRQMNTVIDYYLHNNKLGILKKFQEFVKENT